MSERQLWIPDLHRPLAGFRQWTVSPYASAAEGGLLQSLVGRAGWPETTDMVAECRRKDHSPPAMTCGCGLWAFSDPQALVFGFGQLEGVATVSGIISAWGEILVGVDGMRAECARVEAIFDHPAMPQALPITKRAIADAYQADIVSPTQYEEYCEERGFVLIDEDFWRNFDAG
jgi:hypothetical protein